MACVVSTRAISTQERPFGKYHFGLQFPLGGRSQPETWDGSAILASVARIITPIHDSDNGRLGTLRPQDPNPHGCPMPNVRYKPIYRQAILWLAVWFASPASFCPACPCSTADTQICCGKPIGFDDGDACAGCRQAADSSLSPRFSCPCTDECPCHCKCDEDHASRVSIRSITVVDHLQFGELAKQTSELAASTHHHLSGSDVQLAPACTALQRCVSLSRFAL